MTSEPQARCPSKDIHSGPVARRNSNTRSRRIGYGHFSSGEGGYSTVEAVLLLPVLVALTLMVVQYALVWHARGVAESAARLGAQAARAYAATDVDGSRQITQYLQTVDPELLRAAHVEVTRTPTTVSVRIQAHVLPVPGMPLSIGIDERSSGPIERFVAGGTP